MERKQDHEFEFIRILFTSILGKTYCIEISSDRLEEVFQEGICFDGSSVPGYANVNSSDLVLRPTVKEPLSALWDTSMVIVPCAVYETSGKPHDCDPIQVLSKVVAEVRKQGFELIVGFELEFFLVRKDGESIVPADRGGYFSSGSDDSGHKVRRESIQALKGMGIETTTHHHEVARGQHEIGFRHTTAEQAALWLMLGKHVISEVAHRHGLIATFMAKPFEGMNGSGMHIHQSLWTEDLRSNVFASGEASRISSLGERYIAGILKHAGALSAIVAPTVNSFKRLVPGFEAPTRIAWGPKNRTSMLRVPHFNGSQAAARIEFRCPDPSSSPHLALAAILASGMDGVNAQLTPPKPTTKDLFHEDANVDSLPASLTSALDELANTIAIRRILGSRILDEFLELKRTEWERYSEAENNSDITQISKWEIEEYLTF
ncbi:MAG: glutamine synthetase family protein [Candidatus Thorarchaeota archaeon]